MVAFEPKNREPGSRSDIVAVWEWAEKKLLWQKELDSEVEAASFSAEGEHILVCTVEQPGLRRFDTTSGEERGASRFQEIADHWRFSHDRSALLTIEAFKALLYDTKSGKPRMQVMKGNLKMHLGVGDLSFESDLAVLGDSNGKIHLRRIGQQGASDAPNLKFTLSGHVNGVKRVDYLSDRMLASASRDGTIRFWDTTTGTLDRKYQVIGDKEFEDTGEVFGNGEQPKFSPLPGENTLAVLTKVKNDRGFSKDAIGRLDRERGLLPGVLDVPSVRIFHCLPNEKQIVVSNARSIGVFDLASGQQLHELQEMDGTREISSDAEGKLVAISSFDELAIYETKAWERVFHVEDIDPLSFDISPDSRSLVVNDHTKVRIFDIESGKQKAEFSHTEFPQAPYRSVDWSPNGKVIAVATFRNVSIFDAKSNELLLTIEPGNDSPAVRFSPDGTQLAFTVEHDIKIYDVSVFADAPVETITDDANKPKTQPAPAEPEFRTWSSANGKFTLKAKLISFTDGKVVLEREDGARVTVPATTLSKQDNEFLKP